MSARPLLLLLVLSSLSGCAALGGGSGWHDCGDGSTLHGEWTQPGLYEALPAQSGDGYVVVLREAAPPRVSEPVLEARWGPMSLEEFAYGRFPDQAAVHREGARLYLGVTADASRTQESALADVETLLRALGLAEADAARYQEALREAWEPAPPGVQNHAARVGFTGDVDWSRVVRYLFTDAIATSAHGDLRRVEEGAWSYTVRVGARVLMDRAEQPLARIEVAPDDRVIAFVAMAPQEPREAAFARINATLARAGAPTATFDGYEGAQLTC